MAANFAVKYAATSAGPRHVASGKCSTVSSVQKDAG